MVKIVVGLSRPKEWKAFAALIMAAYGIPYDHVYIKFHSDKYNRDIIYQASKTMVNFVGSDMFLANNLSIYEFEVQIPDDKIVAMMQFMIDNAGKPYGVRQAFGMGIVRICEIFGKYIENPFKDDGKTYVCSKIAAYILEQFAGAVIPRDIDDITPKDLYDYFQKINAAAALQTKPLSQ